MSGPFYGSLAASASVFVAILTALLVNRYVQIKADRRQLTQRINEKERQLEDLKEDRDEYQEIVDTIRKEKEEELREEAEDNIDDFINDHLTENFYHPIETLTVDKLYRELLDYEGCGDADELEDSQEYEHHRDVLEDRFDKIKDVVLNRTVHEFAYQHEGDGRDILQESEEQPQEVDEERDEEVEELLDAVKADHDPLQKDEFIEKYKEEYNLNQLDDRTKELLEDEYDEVVDKDFSAEDLDFSDTFAPTQRAVAQMLQDALGPMTNDLAVEPALPEIAGNDLGVDQRERQYERARDNLVQAKSEIESLKRDKQDLEDQKNRLNPGDLTTTLFANAATIFLSVVIPMAAYLAVETNTTITVPQLLSHTEVNIFFSWLLGLIIVFIAIIIRLNGDSEESSG
jgi:hypothetical protein